MPSKSMISVNWSQSGKHEELSKYPLTVRLLGEDLLRLFKNGMV